MLIRARILVFLIFVFSSSSFADLCEFVYKSNKNQLYSEDIKSIGKLNFIDDLTARIQKYKNKNLNPEIELYKGNIDIAVTNWGPVFRKVEASALRAKNYKMIIKGVQKGIKLSKKDYSLFLKEEGLPQYLINKHLDSLYEQGPEVYLKTLSKNLRKEQRILGNNYEKYHKIRTSLDSTYNSKACTSNCKKSIEDLYDSIGITSSRERKLYRELVQNRKSIPKKIIDDIFNSHPESLLISKRKKLINEALGIIKKYLSKTKFMTGVFNKFSNLKLTKNSKLVKFFKRIYDRRAIQLHDVSMTKIGYSNISVSKKLELLDSEIKGIDLEDFLTDFSRHYDGKVQKSFLEMKEIVNSKPKYSYLKESFNRAEALGKKIGIMSKTSPKNLNFLIAGLVIGGGTIGYLSYDMSDAQEVDPNGDDQDVQVIDDIIDLDEYDYEEDIIILKYNGNVENEIYSILVDTMDVYTQVSEK